MVFLSSRNRAILGLAFDAWMVGLASMAVAAMPLLRAVDHYAFHHQSGSDWLILQSIGLYLGMIPISAFLVATIGVLLSAPLFAIATAFAFAFQSSTVRFPNLMSLLAALTTISLVSWFSASTISNEVEKTQTFAQQFWASTTRSDTLVFAVPVWIAAQYFCRKMRNLPDGRRSCVLSRLSLKNLP